VTAIPTAPTRASTPIAGFRFFESQIQKAASPISIVSPAEIAAMPQPVGSQKIAATMASAKSRGRLQDHDRRAYVHVLE
jgi:hypothetical protein